MQALFQRHLGQRVVHEVDEGGFGGTETRLAVPHQVQVDIGHATVGRQGPQLSFRDFTAHDVLGHAADAPTGQHHAADFLQAAGLTDHRTLHAFAGTEHRQR